MSVSVATRGQTDMRGLGTAGRAVRLERFRLSRVERRTGVLLIAVSRVTPRAATVTGPTSTFMGAGQPSMMANDQHQPASSRAIATFAVVARFLRAMNWTQR